MRMVRCHKTSHIMDDLNPSFPEFVIASRHLNGNDPNRVISFDVRLLRLTPSIFEHPGY